MNLTPPRIARVPFALRWLLAIGVVLAIYASHVVAVVVVARPHSTGFLLLEGAVASACMVGILYLFMRHAVVPRLRDIGLYGLFLWAAAAACLVLPMSVFAFLAMCLVPSNFVPSYEDAA